MKKIMLIGCLLIFTLGNLFAISFGFHALEIRTDPEFSSGVFPTSLLYQFDFPVPQILDGNSTKLVFRIDNGIDFRTLRQEPTTGLPYATNPNDSEWNYPKNYIALFDEMNLRFSQGFMNSSLSDRNMLNVWISLDFRFENAYERFDYLFDPSNMDGLFLLSPAISVDKPAVERFSSWVGQPELASEPGAIGNRSRKNASITLGFDVDWMQDDVTRRNGIYNYLGIRLNPKWFNIFNSDYHDYLLIWDTLHCSFTPYALKNGNRAWFSIVLDNETNYRFIAGSKVPYYIQGGMIYGTRALNTAHVITNRTSLTLYGPQINSDDCYPFISGFVDFGLSFGSLLNSYEPVDYLETVASVGFRAEFVIFHIANFYYELGYVFDNVLEEPNKTVSRIGFSFGI